MNQRAKDVFFGAVMMVACSGEKPIPKFVGPPEPLLITTYAVVRIEHGGGVDNLVRQYAHDGARIERAYLIMGAGSPIEAEIVGKKLKIRITDPRRVRIVGNR